MNPDTLGATLRDIATEVEQPPLLDDDETTETLIRLLAALRVGLRELGVAQTTLEQEIASRAGAKTFIVEGLGQVEILTNVIRKKWDRPDLLRAVLDSRLVNEATGEVVDETPIDRVLAVWNLGAPRVTALRARQLDPDEFCETTFDGYRVRIG